jgi:hypothetical protein
MQFDHATRDEFLRITVGMDRLAGGERTGEGQVGESIGYRDSGFDAGGKELSRSESTKKEVKRKSTHETILTFPHLQ